MTKIERTMYCFELKDRKKIELYKLENGLTYRKMAKMLKINPEQLSAIINGKVNCSQKLKDKFKNLFGLDF